AADLTPTRLAAPAPATPSGQRPWWRRTRVKADAATSLPAPPPHAAAASVITPNKPAPPMPAAASPQLPSPPPPAPATAADKAAAQAVNTTADAGWPSAAQTTPPIVPVAAPGDQFAPPAFGETDAIPVVPPLPAQPIHATPTRHQPSRPEPDA